MDSRAFIDSSEKFSEDRPAPDSVILYSHDKVYTRSGAALRIAWRLRFPLPLLCIAFILPPFLRNGIYDLIARNRYRWFGKRNSCFIPEGELKQKFLG